jgi:hypothetical protein
MFVPEALQIRRQIARPRRRNQQIAAELKIERFQMRIGFTLSDAGQPLVGGQVLSRRRAEGQDNAPKQAPVFPDGCVPQFRVRFRGGPGQGRRTRCRQIAVEGDARFPAVVVGGRREEQGEGVRLLEHQAPVCRLERSPVGKRAKERLEAHASLFPVLRGAPGQDQRMPAHRVRHGVRGAIQRDLQVERAGPRGRDVHNKHVVRR